MASKRRGYKSTLWYSDDDGATWTQVANLKNIKWPEIKRGKVDISHLESEGDYEESMPGMKKTSEVTADGYFTEDDYVLLKDMIDADPEEYDTDAPLTWKVELPKVSTQTTPANNTFPGWLTTLGGGDLNVEDNAFMCPVAVQPTGPITFNEGS